MSQPTPCLELEELAAFVDGRLTGGARERVLAHLSECAACHELWVATLEGVEEELGRRSVSVPLVSRRRRLAWRALGALAAAASIALAIVVAWRAGFSREIEPRLAALPGAAERLGDRWSEPAWSVMRGAGPDVSEPARAFRLGARGAALRMALATGDREIAARLARESESLLADLPFAAPTALAFGDLAERARETPLATLVELAEAACDRGREMVDARRFDLGRWAEQGRLGALLGATELLASRRFRAVGRGGLAADPELAAAVERILALSDDGLAPDELPALERGYRDLLALGGDSR